jgi:hypothetical protein
LGDPARSTALVASGRERAAAMSMERLAGCYVEQYEALLQRVPSQGPQRRRRRTRPTG